jgi:hypothetical protein
MKAEKRSHQTDLEAIVSVVEENEQVGVREV